MSSTPMELSMESKFDKDESPPLAATHENLASFHEDVQYLWCSDIPVYENPPSALHFLRNHVALSRPCIIRNSILASGDTQRAADDNAATSEEMEGKVPLTMTLDDLVQFFPNVREDRNDGANDTPPRDSQLPTLCVDVTPDGHGDCLRRVATVDGNISEEEEKVFVKPLELEMSLSDFCSRLRKGRAKQHSREDILEKIFESSCDDNRKEADRASEYDENFFEECVLYYSRQNDCLRQELSPLWNLKRHSNGDIDDANVPFVFPRTFPWAEEAFFGDSDGRVGPDAVNLWMGDERAVSAMHKDHYENLFYVLSGEKVFGLCPPSDTPFLYEREVLSGRFRAFRGCEDQDKDEHPQNTKWCVSLDRVEEENDTNSTEQHSKVHWIATDLFREHLDRQSHDKNFPLSKYAHPITIKVRAGELLYLPSLWFHRVTQTEETVGINYWYDMNFESPMWCYFHFLQQLQSQTKEKVSMS